MVITNALAVVGSVFKANEKSHIHFESSTFRKEPILLPNPRIIRLCTKENKRVNY